jgi:hypothetical protein
LYDPNGSLKTDGNKGITNIIYNYLNLPERIEFTGRRTIAFVYDATGTEMSEIHYEQ